MTHSFRGVEEEVSIQFNAHPMQRKQNTIIHIFIHHWTEMDFCYNLLNQFSVGLKLDLDASFEELVVDILGN